MILAWAKKQAVMIGLLVMVFGFGITAGGFGGWQLCKTGGYKAEIKEKDRELKGIDKIDKRRDKRAGELEKTREVIRYVKDSRKCNILDGTIPKPYIDSMRRFYSSQKR